MQMLNLDVCHARVNSRNFGFIQTHENNTKRPCPKQKRNMTPLFWVDLTFEWYEDHMVLRVYYFCLEPTVTKDTWIRTTSITVMVIFLKVAFWKLLDHSYIQSPLSAVTRHTDNNILKDTLQFYILWTWINMHTISFIKTVVNVTERRIDGSAWKKVSSTKIQVCTWKNIAPKEKACFTYFMLFFFSET